MTVIVNDVVRKSSIATAIQRSKWMSCWDGSLGRTRRSVWRRPLLKRSNCAAEQDLHRRQRYQSHEDGQSRHFDAISASVKISSVDKDGSQHHGPRTTKSRSSGNAVPRRLAHRRQRKQRASRLRLNFPRYVGGAMARVLPTPMMNVVNGGVHFDVRRRFQEFLIMPVSAATVCRGGALGRHFVLLKAAEELGPGACNVGDEGDWHNLRNLSGARLRVEAIRPPATTLASTSTLPAVRHLQVLPARKCTAGGGRRRRARSKNKLNISIYKLADAYPILSIRGLRVAEQDWTGWKLLTDKIGGKRQLVGDDIFVTNVEILDAGLGGESGTPDSHQGQPDRLPQRDAGRRRCNSAPVVYRDVASVREKPRFDHRRSRGGDQLRTDQSRFALQGRTAWRNPNQPSPDQRGAGRSGLAGAGRDASKLAVQGSLPLAGSAAAAGCSFSYRAMIGSRLSLGQNFGEPISFKQEAFQYDPPRPPRATVSMSRDSG